jgi:hypothetical protein
MISSSSQIFIKSTNTNIYKINHKYLLNLIKIYFLKEKKNKHLISVNYLYLKYFKMFYFIFIFISL